MVGYMHEHGLGVSRNYELAWTYYDRARESGHADRSDVNQGLDGMPIELLVLLAKTRCVEGMAAELVQFSLGWKGQ